ncbi:phage integrase SAM-like domain-containing protein [Dyadobacter luteus]|nr:phage integrase SAM-like domain-containing protein [Dyadobacter luteus]
MEILFWRHSTAAQKKHGSCTLYLRITVNGERADLGSTGIKVFSGHWIDQAQRINGKDPYANFKNEQVALAQTRLLAIYNELLRKNQGISADRIKRLHQRPESVTYLTAFDLFEKEYYKDSSIAKSTKDRLKTVKQSIVSFLLEQRLQNILIEEFDTAVMNNYRQWCKSQNFKEGYYLRNMREVKRITEFAKSKKLIDFDPLEDYKIGREKIAKPVYLDSVQLSIWKSHKFQNSSAQQVADLFVLYARTGFHYRDLMQVIKKPKDYVTTGIDGKQWVMKPRQKNEIDAKVPVHEFPEVKEIVDKYGGWSKLPTMANSTINDWLKICVADFNMHVEPFFRVYNGLSVKHGRSSFCDYCLNELVLPEKSILTMMGRESASELKRYARADERGIVNGFLISKAALAS